MKRVKLLFLAGVFLVAAPALAQTLRLHGPSPGQALVNAAVADYQRGSRSALAVTYGVSGTGAALARLCRGEIEAVVATRPIVRQELESCAGVPFVEVPVAFDAIVIVVNPRNAYLTDLSLDALGRLWAQASEGKLIRWDQLDPELPKLPVKLYGPVARSEGASYFNAAVLAGRESRGDYVSSVDESVLSAAVARDDEALSTVSLPTYLENRARLKALPVAEAGAGPVMASAEAVASGQYRVLARPLVLYVQVSALDDAQIQQFFGNWLAKGARIAGEAKLVPLTAPTYAAGSVRLRKRVPGTLWEGAITVGETLSEVERRLTGK
jgi:phosphate transport system substrate-binding protein